jgi:hypothetical protein
MKNFTLNKYQKSNAGSSSLIYLIAIGVFINLSIIKSHAVPSFARQTGLACVACHTTFPELNSFGRQFKLNGYTMTNIPTIDAANDSDINRLSLLSTSPLSVMAMASYSNVNTKVPGTQNDNIQFPQQLSLFCAGEVTHHIGTFIQLTYDPTTGTIGLDNSDVRYSNHVSLVSKDLLYGLTLNNNPTVQDVWNTIPAWRFPYSTSGVAPSPAAATLTEGALAGQVAGLGTYGLFNNLLYYEFSLYRSATQGPTDTTVANIISGVAPYWRLALQHQFDKHYLMIGTRGMSANLLYPNLLEGSKDYFTDFGFDLQYEYLLPKAIFTLHSSIIMENRKLNATLGNADSASSKLNSFKIDANLYLNKGIGFTVGYFNIMGDKNSINGTFNGLPDSNGSMIEINYLPWYNTKFSIQYVMYNKFDGQANNYDGTGRNASQNNTLYCLAWFSF